MLAVLMAVAFLAAGTGFTYAQAQNVPLPRPRPTDLGPAAKIDKNNDKASNSQVGVKPDETKPDEAKSQDKADDKTDDKTGEKKAAGPPPPSACFAALKAIASIRPMPPINGKGGCEATDVVALDAVTLSDDRHIPFEPTPVLRCPMAAALAEWVRGDLAPAATKLGSPLHSIENFDSVECRGRNRIVGAKLSEHGKANALDVRGVKLEDGTLARFTDTQVDLEFREAVRKSVCDRFMTILGPGSDGYHEDHIHLDLAERSNNYRICQWDIRQPVQRSSPSPHIAATGEPTPHIGVISPARP